MPIYARCVVGLGGVWIERMDEALHLGENRGLGAPMGRRTRQTTASGGRTCPRMATGKFAFPQIRTRLVLLKKSAPSRIRTYAHGSGGRCSLP